MTWVHTTQKNKNNFQEGEESPKSVNLPVSGGDTEQFCYFQDRARTN
jgi:hypothetical protein